MRPIATVAILIATTFLLSAADQVDPRFEKWRESSHQIFATHHLIAYVRLAHIDRKGAPFEFRYDRYPDGPERAQRRAFAIDMRQPDVGDEMVGRKNRSE